MISYYLMKGQGKLAARQLHESLIKVSVNVGVEVVVP